MGMAAVIQEKGAPTTSCGRRSRSGLPRVVRYVFAARPWA